MLVLAAERLAMVLLGTFPNSPELWRVWLVLRQASGNFWMLVHRFVAVSVFWEIAAVGVATLAIWTFLSVTRPVAVRFLANHAALVAFGAMVFAGQQSMVASIFDRVPVLEGFRFPVAIDMNGLTVAMFIMGLCACAYCHFLFLSTSRQRARVKRFALQAVERNL
ncbi:hypothetical protein M2281_005500 [Mesorhizobium soli]|uniref:hypothetical protein n=1 Tax=Pseudaminobacter soli (ex Li et al. 2025) TaxID=1295366 RepID=UPI00247306E6|nr:hypothetical protein [Mesorhizobium soli]MDH6234879.1 hypothetical protein [Mesorhizobium soli]